MSLIDIKESVIGSWLGKISSLAREYRWYVGGVGGSALAWYLLHGWMRTTGSRGTLPPGPRGWPFIGNICFSLRDLHLDGVRLRENYGDVICLNTFRSCFVILNGPAAIKEAFVKNSEDLSTIVPFLDTINNLTGFEDDIFAQPYNAGEWLEHKRFVVKTLRHFGFSSSAADTIILREVDKMSSTLSAANGRPLNPRNVAQFTSAGVVFSILLGKNWEHDDAEFLDLLKKEKRWADTYFGEEVAQMEDYPVFIQKAFYRRLRINFAKVTTEYLDGLERIIANHILECDVDNPHDVIDAYIRERGLGLDTRRLACNMVVYTTDAIDTVSSVFANTLFYLAKYPDLQSRVTAQIEGVIGSSRKVMLKDKVSLVLLEAVVYEALRLYTVMPVMVPRVAQNDVIVQGYVIPKNALVFGNTWSVHMDPKRYPEPNKFRLDHFIDDKGSLKSLDYFMSFGAGRRTCIGEQLTKMEVFLMVGNILQKFRISFPDGFVPVEDDGYIFKGPHRKLPPYELIFTPR